MRPLSYSLFRRATVALLLATLLPATPAAAGPLRDMLKARQDAAADMESSDDAPSTFPLPAGARLLRDVPYGSHERQRMDVYLPADRTHTKFLRPVILMVHGGAWRLGDKAMRRVVENKVRHWLPQGFILVSTNYRLLPEATPEEQSRDVARALAKAQAMAEEWGGDPQHFILMGHSAGAHLVALLNARPAEAHALGARAWLGTVALDSAAMNVVQIMEGRHLRFYDKAFGKHPSDWQRASPALQLVKEAPPLLAVCSSQRDDSCRQAEGLQARGKALGTRIEVLPQDLSHGEINAKLGLPGAYTEAVDTFLHSLRPATRP